MDKVRKDERKNWFYSYNMIFTIDISCHAKLVYLFLCRCADSEAQSFPSRNTITQNCSISLTSVKNAIRELVEARLLSKDEQFRPDRSQTSNLYTIFPEPYEVQDLCSDAIDLKAVPEEIEESGNDFDEPSSPAGAQTDREGSKYARPRSNNIPHAGQNTPAPRSKYGPLEGLPIGSTIHQEVQKNVGLKKKNRKTTYILQNTS